MPSPIRIPGFSPWHAFSTRSGGVSAPPRDSLDLSLAASGNSVADDIAENAQRLARVLGITPSQIAAVRQVHGTRIVEVAEGGSSGIDIDTICLPPAADESLLQPPLAEADGLMTCLRGVALAIRTADCVPILIAAKPHRSHLPVIAALHAGWRGTLGCIAEKAVQLIRSRFGIAPDALTAAIGPSIGRCCYEVSPALADDFIRQFGSGCADLTDAAHPHLDLTAANRMALMRAGLNPDDIFASGLCTSCRADLFFSHRRDAGRTGRQMSLIMLPPQ